MVDELTQDLIREIDDLSCRVKHLEVVEYPVGWQKIEEQILVAPAVSVTFANIPSIYRSLVLHTSTRTSRVNTRDFLRLNFNGDVGANYDRNVRIWDGAGVVVTAAATGATTMIFGVIEGSTSVANAFAPSEITILQYANASNMTQVLASTSKVGSRVAVAQLELSMCGGNWTSVAVVTSIVLTPNTGPNFTAGCVFTLYGVL